MLREAPLDAFVKTLRAEIVQLGRATSARAVTHLHWGGGTPTFFDDQQLRMLFNRLRSYFDFSPEGEYSIEIDPRTVNAERVGALHDMGFNRMSLGVQDFDPDVQRAAVEAVIGGERVGRRKVPFADQAAHHRLFLAPDFAAGDFRSC